MKTKDDIISELKSSFKPLEPGKPFTVKPFQPEDAMGVVRCCYSVYGAAYPIDTYYLPEKLIQENQNGNIYSVVARTNDGEIIGHGALFRSSPPYDELYEAGQYIIRSEYRGSRAAYNINRTVLNYASELGIAGFYGEVVTNHVIMQKFGDRAGAAGTAIEIDLMPSEAYENDHRVSGRVSIILQFVILKDRPHDIFVPADYIANIGDAVKTMNLDRKIHTQQSGNTDRKNSVTKTEYFDFAGVGRFHVSEFGADFYSAFSEFEKEIISRDYQVSQVFITIARENSGEIFSMLNNAGYFYGGYLPRWVDSDALLLQRTVKPPVFEGINLYQQKARELLEFIKQDWKRVSSL